MSSLDVEKTRTLRRERPLAPTFLAFLFGDTHSRPEPRHTAWTIAVSVMCVPACTFELGTILHSNLSVRGRPSQAEESIACGMHPQQSLMIKLSSQAHKRIPQRPTTLGGCAAHVTYFLAQKLRAPCVRGDETPAWQRQPAHKPQRL